MKFFMLSPYLSAFKIETPSIGKPLKASTPFLDAEISSRYVDSTAALERKSLYSDCVMPAGLLVGICMSCTRSVVSVLVSHQRPLRLSSFYASSYLCAMSNPGSLTYPMTLPIVFYGALGLASFCSFI